MKQEFPATVFINASRSYDGTVCFHAHFCDMSEYGYFLVEKKQITVEADIPDDFNIDAIEIDALKKEKTRIQAEAQNKLTKIEERIQSLLCLEHKAG